MVFLNFLFVDLSLCQSEVITEADDDDDCLLNFVFTNSLEHLQFYSTVVTDKQKWSLINGLASSIGRLFVHYDLKWFSTLGRFASDKV